MPTHGRQQRCDGCRAVLGQPPARLPGRNRPAPDPPPADRPWAPLECVAFVAQLADLSRDVGPRALAAALTPGRLEKLLDGVRRMAAPPAPAGVLSCA